MNSFGGSTLLGAVLLVLVDSPGGDTCSPPGPGWRPPTDQERILSANRVLYAEVRRTFPDDTGLSWRRNLYTAEVEVFCIFKGPRTHRISNITDVGHIGGMCHSTTLTAGDSYVILLSPATGVMIPTWTIQAEWSELTQYTSPCRLTKLYPFGTTEDSVPWTCPTPAPPGECLDHDDFPPMYENPTLPELEN